MTKPSELNRPRGFTLSLLPWILGAAMLVVYLLTFNHWVSVLNVPFAMEIAGWNWRADLSGPLYLLATYPLRWLPAGAVPLALSLFAAACSALTLVELARSVALLPHDRTHSQRQAETSPFSLLSIPSRWLPPLFAVLVCGLQISFWENATQGTVESFNLLLFAHLIRCLLEYRISHENSWMNRFALVYGLSIAENWAMAAFLPCFLAAVIWIKGLRFFDTKFLLRSFCLWLAGFSLIMLLPVLARFSSSAHVGLWQGLRFVFGEFAKLKTVSRYDLVLLCLPSLVPIFVISIRWPSYFGDTSPLGIFIATTAFHIVYAVFLVAGIWVSLNVRISPRQINPQYAAFSFLPISYLTALGTGYFSGYLLLVFRNRTTSARHPVHPIVRIGNSAVVVCVWALLPVAAVLLVVRNLPVVLHLRSDTFRNYFSEIEKALPARDAVVLSDDPIKLKFLAAELDRQGKRSGSLLLDTTSIADPNYFYFLDRQYPQFKITELFTNSPAYLRVPIAAINLLQKLSESHPVYYLQPSFGHFFEFFYLEPHGPVYQMKLLPQDSRIPNLSPELVSQNDAFWRATSENVFARLIQANRPPGPVRNATNWLQRIEKTAHLKNDPDTIAQKLGTYYSRAVNYWGVQLQVAGEYEKAGNWFNQARDLNPNNIAARINLEYNQNFQAGKPPVLLDVATMEERIGNHRKWDWLLNDCGPLDDPNYCYQLAVNDLQASPALPRQSLRQMERVEALAPGTFLLAKFTILQLMLYTKDFSGAIAKADEILSKTVDDDTRIEVFDMLLNAQQYSNVLVKTEAVLHDTPTNVPALFYKGAALLQLQSMDDAQATFNRLMDVRPDNITRSQVFQLFAAAQKTSNLLQMVDSVLKHHPDDPPSLFYKGTGLLQLQEYQDSIAPFTHLLELQPSNYLAYVDRGIAELKIQEYEASRHDYTAAINIRSNIYQAYYGLFEIAYRQKDAPEALKNGNLYLSLAPTNTDEAKLVIKRMQELDEAKPGKH